MNSHDKKALKEACEQLHGIVTVHYNNTPSYVDKADRKHYQLTVANEDHVTSFAKILRCLPDIVRDQEQIPHIIQDLLGVIAHQEVRLANLEQRIEEIAHAKVAVSAQQNINDVVHKLALEGCDITKPEVSIKITAASSATGFATSKANYAQANAGSRNFSAASEISGIVKGLTSLNLSAENSKEFNSNISEILEGTHANYSATNYEGELTFKFESITGSPMAKAKAKQLLNKGASAKTKTNSDT